MNYESGTKNKQSAISNRQSAKMADLPLNNFLTSLKQVLFGKVARLLNSKFRILTAKLEACYE